MFFKAIHAALNEPVGLPNVQDIWISDFYVVCLNVQEVEEVFDSEWSFIVRHPPDGLKQVLHKRMHGHLRENTRLSFLLS